MLVSWIMKLVGLKKKETISCKEVSGIKEEVKAKKSPAKKAVKKSSKSSKKKSSKKKSD